MRTPQRQPPSVTNNVVEKSGFRPIKLIPIIFIVVFATLILRDQFPQVDDFFRSKLQPKQHAAILNCRQSALLQSETPDFARIIKWGKVSNTQNGFLVDHLIIGEMREGEGEQRIDITCHSKTNGEVVMVHRKPYAPNMTTSPQIRPPN